MPDVGLYYDHKIAGCQVFLKIFSALCPKLSIETNPLLLYSYKFVKFVDYLLMVKGRGRVL